MQRRHFKGRIAQRFTIYFLICGLLICVPAGCLYGYWGYQNEISRIEERMLRIHLNALPSITVDLWQNEIARLRIQLHSLLTVSDLHYLELRAENGLRIVQGQAAKSDIISRESPLIFRNNDDQRIQLGTLYMEADLEKVRMYWQDSVLVLLGIITFCLSAVAVLLFLLFRLVISRHLHEIVNYASAYDVEHNHPLKLRYKLKAQINNEMDELAAAINTMREHLHNAIEAAQDSEQFSRTLLQASPIGLMLSRRNGGIVAVNQAYADILGRNVEEISGFEPSELVPKRFEALLLRQQEELEKTGQFGPHEFELIHRNGNLIPVRVRGLLIQRHEESLIWSAIEDISEHKASETALKQGREMAESANRAKSQFIANMSHELRTPLNAIIGYSEMLKDDAQEIGGEELVPDLNKVHTSGKHLLQLVNDVLDISKIEAGKMEVYREVFNLHELLDEVIDTVNPLVSEKSNKLEVHYPKNIENVYTDMTKLRQILFNLIGNAAKFTENGSIVVSCHYEKGEKEDWLICRINDTGIGMTTEQQQKLFQIFMQADPSTTRRFGGTGLGLVITKRFAEMLNGTVSVESVYGEGTTFTVRLPVGKADAIKPRSQDINDTVKSGDHVLVIDDDDSVRELMESYLVRQGYQVSTASNGEEGLALARENIPAAIMLDIMMPDMNGWIVLSTLKDDPELASIPVIIISVFEEKGHGYSLGANEYLIKPVSYIQLKTVLDKYRSEDMEKTPYVMVVEDDRITRGMLESMVERAHWQVSTSENGRIALELLKNDEHHVPDLILLDLMMPEMDGFEFVKQLRASDQWRNIPIIVLTAKDITLEDRVTLGEDVKQIFQKSAYSQEELLKEIRDLLKNVVHAETSPVN